MEAFITFDSHSMTFSMTFGYTLLHFLLYLWYHSRTYELDDCFVWSKLTSEAGLEFTFLQYFQSLLSMKRQLKTLQDTLIEIFWRIPTSQQNISRISRSGSTELLLSIKSCCLKEAIVYSQSGKFGKCFTNLQESSKIFLSVYGLFYTLTKAPS